ALRKEAATVPPSFSQSYSSSGDFLANPTTTSRSSVDPCGVSTSTVLPNFAENPAAGSARSSTLPGSQARAACPSAPFSPDRTKTLPFVGTANLAKETEGRVFMSVGFQNNAEWSATFGRFAAFGNSWTPAAAN